MKKTMLFLMLLCIVGSSAMAGTVAWWRFEAGPVNTQVQSSAVGPAWSADVPDSSGNGNDLSVWATDQFMYRDGVPYSTIPLTGAANNLSVKNTTGGPAMWTSSAEPINSITPAKWTVEATFKLENGGYRTIVGRDSYGTATQGTNTDQGLAALYFQAMPDNAVAVKFCDVDGFWHEAISGTGMITTYDFPTDNDGLNATWYSMAGVSDGRFLSLYLYDHSAPALGYQLVAQTDMTVVNPGSANTALNAGAGDGGDWDAGNFTVARGLYGGGHGDRAWGFIDEVRISDSALLPGSLLLGSGAYNPAVTLAVDVVNADVDAVLGWDAARDPNGVYEVNPGVVDQYVFIGIANDTDPNLYYAGATGDPGNTQASSFGLNVDFDTPYDWAVVAVLEGHEQNLTSASSLGDVDPNNIIGGAFWFESLASVPIITGQPQNLLAPMSGTAEFTVSVNSISEAHYVWYVSTDKANNTPEDDTVVGTDNATLALTGVDASSEGFYYCIVSNGSSTTATSKVAFLEVERLVAWYAFENDLTDSANDNDGSPIVADPNFPLNFDAGKISQAVVLNGTDEAVEIPRSIQNSMTIEFWVKTTSSGGTGGWWEGRGLVDGEMAGSTGDFGVVVRGSKLGFGIGQPDLTISSTSDINDDEWHYCVATRDFASGEMKVYVDGELETVATGPVGTKDAPTALHIGKILAGTNFLAGQMDEVKLYNYPLDEITVANNYTTITGETVCVNSVKPDSQYNLDDTGSSYCKVDLADFAIFASHWLDCALYPDCLE